jgi:hypothetical protein
VSRQDAVGIGGAGANTVGVREGRKAGQCQIAALSPRTDLQMPNPLAAATKDSKPVKN